MSSSKKFCCRFDLEKGVRFLFIMDCIGLFLYIANIIGVVNGFDGADIYFLVVFSHIPIFDNYYTMLLAQSSLVLSLAIIPRMFAWFYVIENKREYHRRFAYYVIRIVTLCILLILQFALFVSLLYFISQFYKRQRTEDISSVLNRLIPLIVVHAFALFITAGVDIYWTVQCKYFAQEGEEMAKLLPVSTYDTGNKSSMHSPMKALGA